MSKPHQSNTTDYQIRVDGVARYYPHNINSESLQTWRDLCNENPTCYVDIVRINTEIIVCQGDYYAMERHFDNKQHKSKG